MCPAPKLPTPPPAIIAPPTLEQLAPKSEGSSDSKRKKRGMSRYKINGGNSEAKTNKVGGIPKRTGV